MSETFKINMYFDEKGEELERLIKYLIINTLKKILLGIKNLF